jgi:hypothetical protein
MVTAEIKLNEEPVKFDLIKIDATKHELRLVPTRVGIYQIHMFLNGQSIKGSPFLIRIDAIASSTDSMWNAATSGSSNTQITTISSTINNHPMNLDNHSKPPGHHLDKDDVFNLTSSSNVNTDEQVKRMSGLRKSLNDINHILTQAQSDNTVSTSMSSAATQLKKLRTELFDLTNQSDDLIVGEEVRLNVKILEYGTNDKLKKTISNLETKVYHNEKPVCHRLEMLPNGVYQIKFLPQKTGAYFVTFFKDGQKIDGSPYRLNVKGKFLKEISRPMFGQVGMPYIIDSKIFYKTFKI